MYLKHNFVTTLLVALCICSFLCTAASATYCSLDRMKKFAMEACEHLFEFESLETRARRSINSGHAKNRYREESSQYLRRSIYPSGGYLKVDHEHFHKLSRLDVSPRYKAKKPSQLMHHDKKMRFKREDKVYHNYSNNISYCCYHKCEEDFFC